MTSVEIHPRPGDSGYRAKVDGINLDIAGYIADPGEDGKVMVSLIVAADSLQIGIPPRQPVQADRRNQAPVTTWGDPSVPDPRSNVPGWSPAHAEDNRGRA